MLLPAFAGLSILSSELTAVLLGAVAGAIFLFEFVQERSRNLCAAALLGTAVLVTLFYVGALFPAPPAPLPLAPPQARSLFPYDYVGATQDVYVYPSLGDVYASVLLLSGLVLAPLLPFAVVGFARERRMVSWTAMLAIGSSSVLVWPFDAIPSWNRWLFMLVFPVLVFACHGAIRVDSRFRTVFLES